MTGADLCFPWKVSFCTETGSTGKTAHASPADASSSLTTRSRPNFCLQKLAGPQAGPPLLVNTSLVEDNALRLDEILKAKDDPSRGNGTKLKHYCRGTCIDRL